MGSVVSADGPGRRSSGDDGQQQTSQPEDTATSKASDAFKPASIYATMVKNSPKIIGWDDAEFQRVAREAYERGRRKRLELRRQHLQAEDGTTPEDYDDDLGSMTLSEEEEAAALRRLGPDESERDILSEIGSGLLSIAAETVTDYLLKGERDDDDYSPSVAEMGTKDATNNTDTSITDNAEWTSSESNELSGRDDATGTRGTNKESSSSMRDTELYIFTINALKWQRDAYLVGAPYADTRKRQRKLEERNRRDVGVDLLSSSLTGAGLVPEMSMAMLQAQIVEAGKLNTSNPPLGQTQLIQLGKWFLPSDTTKDALLPTVLWLPGPTGPLDRPFARAVTNLIPMSQENLDWVVKNNVLWLLKDESWRNYAKYGASGYVTEMQRDTSD